MKLRHEKGQELVEYALIFVFVAIVVISVLMLLGPIIGDVFSAVDESLLPTENVQEPVVPLWVFGLGVLIAFGLGIWTANWDRWPPSPGEENKVDETEKGQGLTEYALLLVLVAIVVIAFLVLMEPLGQALSVFVAALSTETILISAFLVILIILIVVALKRHYSKRD